MGNKPLAPSRLTVWSGDAAQRLRGIGRRPVCNGRPERAPRFFGFVGILCWRCTGLVAGFLIGSAIGPHLFGHRHNIAALLLLVPCAVDALGQRAGRWTSTNTRRAVTGLLGGFGLGIV